MLRQTYYRARFGYRKNCALIHYIREGETMDQLPVIMFPRDQNKVVEGTLYEFIAKPTLGATYVIEENGSKITYRVVHAVGPVAVEGSEGSIVDQILHHTAGPKRTALSESLPTNTRSKLEELKARLAGKKPV